MAEEVGNKFLADIEEVSLDEFLTTAITTPTLPFDLSPLTPLLRKIPIPINPPIIEITSSTPLAGKTHLLYHLTRTALVENTTVTIITTTPNTFSTPRLATLLPKGSETLYLRHLHILPLPPSLPTLLSTLTSLPHHHHPSSDRRVGFIAIDSLTPFNTPPLSTPSADNIYDALLTLTRRLVCPVLYTSHTHSRRPAFGGLLGSQSVVRFGMGRSRVKAFPVRLSVEEAGREAGQRMEVVGRGRFEVWVWEFGVDEGVRRGLREDGGGVVEVFVGREGVELVRRDDGGEEGDGEG